MADEERSRWIRRAREGDPAALEYLFGCLDAPIRKLVRRVAPATVDPDDVVSQTVMVVFDTIAHLRDDAKLVAYALRIASRIIDRERRRSAIARRISTQRGAPDPAILNPERDERLAGLLRTLTESESMLFHFYFIEGKTNRQVAETLGIGNQAVRSRKHRMIQKLRASVGGKGIVVTPS